MQRRILANLASFYTEQQSLDVKDGLARRVQCGLFVGEAPYEYRNIRTDGRGLVEVNPQNAPKVRQIFDLYAYRGDTLDSLAEKPASDCVPYSVTVSTSARAYSRSVCDAAGPPALRTSLEFSLVPFESLDKSVTSTAG